MVDARGRIVPCSGGEAFSEKGFRDFGFEGDGSAEGISCGVQRMPGRRLRRDLVGFIVGLDGDGDGETAGMGANRGGMVCRRPLCAGAPASAAASSGSE
jgi:hypothetical protein